MQVRLTRKALSSRSLQRPEYWYLEPEALHLVYPELKAGEQPAYASTDPKYLHELKILGKALKRLCQQAGLPESSDKNVKDYKGKIDTFIMQVELRLDPKTRSKSRFKNFSDQELKFLKYNFEVVVKHQLDYAQHSSDADKVFLESLTNNLEVCEAGVYEELRTLKEACSNPSQLEAWMVSYRHETLRALSSQWITARAAKGVPVAHSFEKHVTTLFAAILSLQGMPDPEVNLHDQYIPTIQKEVFSGRLRFGTTTRDEQLRRSLSIDNNFDLNGFTNRFKERLAENIVESLASTVQARIREAYATSGSQGVITVLDSYGLTEKFGIDVYKMVVFNEDYTDRELVTPAHLTYWCRVAACCLLESERWIEKLNRVTLRDASGSFRNPDQNPAISLVKLDGLAYIESNGKILTTEKIIDLLKSTKNPTMIRHLVDIDETSFELLLVAFDEMGGKEKIRDLRQARELIKHEKRAEKSWVFDRPEDLSQNLLSVLNLASPDVMQYLNLISRSESFERVLRNMNDAELITHLKSIPHVENLHVGDYWLLILNSVRKEQVSVVLRELRERPEYIIVSAIFNPKLNTEKQIEYYNHLGDLKPIEADSKLYRQRQSLSVNLLVHEIQHGQNQTALRNLSDFVYLLNSEVRKDLITQIELSEQIRAEISNAKDLDLIHFVSALRKKNYFPKLFELLTDEQWLYLAQSYEPENMVDLCENSILGSNFRISAYQLVKKLQVLFEKSAPNIPLSHLLSNYKERENRELFISGQPVDKRIIFDTLAEIYSIHARLKAKTNYQPSDLVNILYSPCYQAAMLDATPEEITDFLHQWMSSVSPIDFKKWVTVALESLSGAKRNQVLDSLKIEVLASYEYLTPKQFTSALDRYPGDSWLTKDAVPYLALSVHVYEHLKSSNKIEALNDLYSGLKVSKLYDSILLTFLLLTWLEYCQEQASSDSQPNSMNLLRYTANINGKDNFFYVIVVPGEGNAIKQLACGRHLKALEKITEKNSQQEILQSVCDPLIIEALDPSLENRELLLKVANFYSADRFTSKDHKEWALILRARLFNDSVPIAQFFTTALPFIDFAVFNRAFFSVLEKNENKLRGFLHSTRWIHQLDFLNKIKRGEMTGFEASLEQLFERLENVPLEDIPVKSLRWILDTCVEKLTSTSVLLRVKDFTHRHELMRKIHPYAECFALHYPEEFKNFIASKRAVLKQEAFDGNLDRDRRDLSLFADRRITLNLFLSFPPKLWPRIFPLIDLEKPFQGEVKEIEERLKLLDLNLTREQRMDAIESLVDSIDNSNLPRYVRGFWTHSETDIYRHRSALLNIRDQLHNCPAGNLEKELEIVHNLTLYWLRFYLNQEDLKPNMNYRIS